MTRTVYRFRLAAVCLALVALAFLQTPGRVAADSKLDLTMNPYGLLARALHMWDASGFFGQLQNQGYGYLWPVGPLFAGLHWAQVTPWVVQRVWWSILLVGGFLGFVRLTRLFGVDSALARVIGGLGYVLSVRILSELTTVSVESWPMAVLPWLLIPLVHGSRGGSPRRWAAASAVAFWMTGAINAVASAAILPAGALYLLTRQRGRRTWSLAAWWALGVALASLWWAVPLLLLGRYSPPFLDWIESAVVTTSRNDPTSVLRGASHWVPYLVDTAGPIWPGGWLLVSNAWAVAGTAVVAVLGVAGLLRRDTPERVFLSLVLCAGLVLTGLGHVSSAGLSGFGGEWIRALLDGPLAPIRNVHKFQPLVTFPLAVGLTWLVQSARHRVAVPGEHRIRVPVAATAAVMGLALAASPALTGSLIGARSFLEIPQYWRETATWLNEQDDGRALVVPAASFGTYIWGRPQDEPLQVLDTQSWAVRDAVPLSSAGNIRLLDEVQRYLETGTGSEGMGQALARSGVRWLVVRNDLATKAAGSALPVLVHQALTASPGIMRAATFGPLLTAFESGDLIVEGGLQRTYPAVEVYSVSAQPDSGPEGVIVRDARSVVSFTGSTEALPGLADSGLLGSSAAIAAGDPVPAGSRVSSVVTDTYRRAEANFGASQGQYSNTLTPTDPFGSDRPVHDYYPVDPQDQLSAARLDGAASVTASSAGSSPFTLRGRAPSSQPWSALDGDDRTAWISGDLGPGVGQWWELDLGSAVLASSATVTVVADSRVGTAPAKIRITTDLGTHAVAVSPTALTQTVTIPGGMFRKLRIELAAVQGGGFGQGFGIAEVSIPGVTVRRPVTTVPADGDGGVVLSARSMGRESCAATSTAIVCDPGLAKAGEERAGVDREVDVAVGGQYRVATRLRPRPGPALDALLRAPSNAIAVTASSQSVSDPAGRAQAAADQNRRTTWIASPLDHAPELDVRLPEQQEVTGIVLQTASDVPASSPFEVTVDVDGVPTTFYTDSDGLIDLPAMTTDRLRLRFGTVHQVRSIDPDSGASQILPVGVTELAVLGGSDTRMLQPEYSRVSMPCGFGPSVQVDGEVAATTDVTATVGGILTGQLARGGSCGDVVTLSPGSHRIQVAASAEWLVEDAYLIPVARPPLAPARSVASEPAPNVVSWQDTRRVVDLETATHARLLETSENYNAGWQARAGGQQLESFRVDGWRQAFLVPAGTSGRIELTYRPDGPYRTALAVGALAALVLLALALVPGRSAAGPVGPAALRRVAIAAPLVAAGLMGGPVGLAAAVLVATAGVEEARRTSPRRGAAVALWLGVVGAAVSLAAQVVRIWPGSLDTGIGYQALLIAGPAMVLGALACLPMRRLDAPDEESASPAGAS